ncbi:unnamed protein product [Aphanomyces euteiches]
MVARLNAEWRVATKLSRQKAYVKPTEGSNNAANLTALVKQRAVVCALGTAEGKNASIQAVIKLNVVVACAKLTAVASNAVKRNVLSGSHTEAPQAGVLTRNPSATAPFPSFSNMISPMLVQYSTAISILNPTEDDVETPSTTTPSTTTPSASASSSTTANHTLTHLLDSMPYMYSLPSLRVDPPEEVVRTNRLKHQLNPIDELIHPTQDAAMTMTSLW